MISRREFFRQLFHPRTLRALSPANDISKLAQTLGVVSEPPDACEQAGLNLSNLDLRHGPGIDDACSSRTDGRAPGCAGALKTGE